VLKLPDWPPVLTSEQLPPPELELLLEEDELLELEELLLEDELELLLLELEELLLDDELPELPSSGGYAFCNRTWNASENQRPACGALSMAPVGLLPLSEFPP
jgi:hypothetical protein